MMVVPPEHEDQGRFLSGPHCSYANGAELDRHANGTFPLNPVSVCHRQARDQAPATDWRGRGPRDQRATLGEGGPPKPR